MRAHFPEMLQFRGPRGLSLQLASIAEREQLSVSALVRRFVCEQVERRFSDKNGQAAEMSRYDGPRGMIAA